MSMKLLKKKINLENLQNFLFYNSLCQQDDNKNYMLGQIIISYIVDQGLMSKCEEFSKIHPSQSNRKEKKHEKISHWSRYRDGR